MAVKPKRPRYTKRGPRIISTNGLATKATLEACRKRGEQEMMELLRRAHPDEALEELALMAQSILCQIDEVSALQQRLVGKLDVLVKVMRKQREAVKTVVGDEREGCGR